MLFKGPYFGCKEKHTVMWNGKATIGILLLLKLCKINFGSDIDTVTKKL